MKNTTNLHFGKRFLSLLTSKSCLLAFTAISLFVSGFGQTAVPCGQRLISNADFTYTAGGTAPARWNASQANATGFIIDQTAAGYAYVPTGNLSNVQTEVNPGNTQNATRQYAIVQNPQDLNPQYANIPSDGMIVINPLQGQQDQFAQFQISGLNPNTEYDIEIKLYNVLNYTPTNSCCWNQMLKAETVGNGNNAHDGNSDNGSTSTNGSFNWDMGGNFIQTIPRPNAGGTSIILKGKKVLGSATTGFTITFSQGADGNYKENAFVMGIDYIKVYGCQQEAINISGGTPNVCEASQFTLTAQGIGPAGSTYSWYKNGTLIPGRTSDTLNVISAFSPGIADTYKAVGQWDNISTTLTSKLCCSSVNGISDEVFRQSFNGLTYTCIPNRFGGYANIPAGSSIDPAYIYSGTTCDGMNDGHYAVVQSSYAGDYWRAAKPEAEVKDHTGVAGSGALFVNAINNNSTGQKQAFFKSTLTGLCNNTTYDFSIWYASLALSGEISPNMEFDVLQGGTIIDSIITGQVPGDQKWYQADVTFKTPPTGTPVYTLQAVNLITAGTTGGGNDLMLDDIVVKKCTPGINLYQNGTTDSVISVCDNNPVDITVNTFYSLPLEITGSTTGTVYYQWMSATSPAGPWTLIGTPETIGTFSATPTATTTYYRAKVSASYASAATGTVPIATDCGNDAMTNSFSLTKGGNFSVPPITGATSYCMGNTMTLTGDPGTGDQWEWRKGNTATTATPIAGYTYSNTAANKVYTKTFAIADTGNYYFYSKTTAGCESYSTVHVITTPLPTIATVASAATVCISSNAQTTTLAYTGTTGNPLTYGIYWSPAAITAGLLNGDPDSDLPNSSPVVLSVAANAAAGTFTGTIKLNGSGCVDTGRTFTLTINPLPTITPAATAASVCSSTSAQTTTLAYTATTGNPTKYTITWDAAALSAGLTNVSSTNLPASPIILNVPANTAAATYNGTITVSNANSCGSTGAAFTLTVNSLISPSDISCGTATNSSVQFNWTTLANATSYTISHTVNGGASISDASTTAGTYSYNSLNPGDIVVITVLPVGTGCFKSASFSCASTTCPALAPHAPTSDITICNNTTATHTLTTPVGSTITWTNSNTAIGLGASGSGIANVLTFNFTATNSTASDISGKIRTIFTVTSGGSACNYPDSFNIIVNPGAVATLTSAVNTNAQTVCLNNAITNITYSITGTGNNASVSGLPNGVSGAYNAGVFTISGTPTQSGTFNYTVTATGTCTNGTATGTINVSALPIINGGTGVSKGGTTQLTGNGTPATSAPWISLDQSFATVDNNGLVSGIADGTARIIYKNIGGCTDTVLVTVTSNAVISGDTTICAGSTTQLIGSGIAATINPWVSSDPTVATISNSGLVTSYKAGISIITYTDSKGKDTTVHLIVSVLPTITFTTNNVCLNKSITFNGSGTPATSNPWLSLNNTIATVSNGTVTGKSTGNGNYIVYTDNNGCADTASITVNGLPTVSPSAPIGVCANGGTITLTGSATAASSNAWQSLNPTIATVNSTSGVVTGVAGGNSQIVYTNSNGCTDTVSVTVNVLPAAPTGKDGARCGSGQVGLSIVSAVPATDTVKWYTTSTLTDNPTKGINYTPTLTTVGTTPFYATETNISGCVSAATTVNAIVSSGPTPPTGVGIAKCGSGSVILNASINGDPTDVIIWYSDAVLTSIVPNIAPPGTGFETPILTDTTDYYITEVNTTGCASIPVKVTATINPVPVAPTAKDSAICGPGSVIIGATKSGAASDVLTWYADENLTMSVPGNNTTYTTPPLTTTTPYYVTETSAANCVSSATTVTAAIKDVPLAPTAIDSSNCGPGMVYLGAIPETTTDTIKWYTNSGLTNKVATGISYTTPSLNAPSTLYYITATNLVGCTSTSPTTVTATILTKPDAQLTSFAAVCQEAPAFALSGGTPAGGSYSGLGVISDSAFNPQQAGPGNIEIIYTYIMSNGCSDTAIRFIKIVATPVIDYGGTVSVMQGDSVTLSPVKPRTDLSYTWLPSLYLDNDTSATPVSRPVDSVTYTIVAQSSAGCSTSTTLFVQVLRDFVVPNTFTPNNDGINDKWMIAELPNFPIQWVQIFDRYGQLLFESHGYGTPWDGTYKGKQLPAGTYYYIIEVNGLLTPKTGYVTILR